jgi:hypothetical protein
MVHLLAALLLPAEFQEDGWLSPSIDVHAFGVVLLQLLTNKPAMMTHAAAAAMVAEVAAAEAAAAAVPGASGSGQPFGAAQGDDGGDREPRERSFLKGAFMSVNVGSEGAGGDSDGDCGSGSKSTAMLGSAEPSDDSDDSDDSDESAYWEGVGTAGVAGGSGSGPSRPLARVWAEAYTGANAAALADSLWSPGSKVEASAQRQAALGACTALSAQAVKCVGKRAQRVAMSLVRKDLLRAARMANSA